MSDEKIDYESAPAFLLGLGFRKTKTILSHDHCKDDGEACIWSDGVVMALVCNNMADYYGRDCIMLEREDLLDKWSHAPVVARFPADAEAIGKAVEFLRTEEGKTYSKKFGYLGDNPLHAFEERWAEKENDE